LPAPSFSTRKGMGAGRHPQHGRETVQLRALEKPLSTAEMTRAGHQVYALLQLSKSDVKPPCLFATHVRSDVTRSNLLAGSSFQAMPTRPVIAPGLMNPRRTRLFRLSLGPLSRRTRCKGLGIYISPCWPRQQTAACERLSKGHGEGF